MVATRRRSNSRVTIADVAREAGVNKGTVSRALRGVPGVGHSTRQRILAAAHRLDFSASHIATALATGMSQTIGVVIPNLKSWYFGEVAAGASEVLIPAGYRIELVNLDMDSDFLDINSPDFARLVTELGQGRGPDALLFAGNVADPGRDNTSGLAGVPVATPGDSGDQRAGRGDRQPGRRPDGGRAPDRAGPPAIAVVDGRLAEGGDTRLWDQRTAGFAEGYGGRGALLRRCAARLPRRLPNRRRGAGGRWPARTAPTARAAHRRLLPYRRAGVRFDLGPAPTRGAVPGRHLGRRVRRPPHVALLGADDTINQYAHEQGARAAWALLDALDDSHAAMYEVVADWPTLTVQLVERESTRQI